MTNCFPDALIGFICYVASCICEFTMYVSMCWGVKRWRVLVWSLMHLLCAWDGGRGRLHGQPQCAARTLAAAVGAATRRHTLQGRIHSLAVDRPPNESMNQYMYI